MTEFIYLPVDEFQTYSEEEAELIRAADLLRVRGFTSGDEELHLIGGMARDAAINNIRKDQAAGVRGAVKAEQEETP